MHSRIVCPIICVLALVAATAQAELMHHWKLDEDTAEGAAAAADFVGGNDGIINGATTVKGQIGNAFLFNGVDNTVQIDDFSTANLKSMTITFWMNPDVGYTTTGGYKRIISANDWWEAIMQPDSGTLGNNFYQAGGEYPQSTVAPLEGEWTHVAMTSVLGTAANPGLTEIYINGELNVAANNADDDWDGGSFMMGYRFAGGGEHYKGLLDDVRIYNELLSAEDIKSVMEGVPTRAHDPSPEDGATGVSLDQVLSWKTGLDIEGPNFPNPAITGHNLWLSVAYDPINPPAWPDWRDPGVQIIELPADVDPADGNVDPVASYSPVTLQIDALYFWIVDESLGAEHPRDWDNIIQGKLWSFDTYINRPADDTVVLNDVVSDSYKGTQLTWKTGMVKDAEAAIDFGLALPHQYNPESETIYPLVLYLHGAGARGSQITNVLHRQTAQEFAFYGQTDSQYAAFVLAPQVPSNQLWTGVPWEDGPYEQTDATYTDSMKLTDMLLAYLINPDNNVTLAAFGLDASDIDVTRIYVTGDSMGSYGTWDMIGRHPGLFAAAIASSGSGPKNRLAEILETPFWTIHGIVDTLVPNALPSAQDPDGAGTLGMLALIDPTFDNTGPTDLITLDDFRKTDDNPAPTDSLIYTEFPSGYNHATVAMQWTTLVPGVKEWLFAHQSAGPPIEPPALIEIAPATSFEATGDGGMVLSINGIGIDEMILGTTTFPNLPKHTQFPPEGADDFDLSTASAGDDQPYVNIMYDQSVSTIYICENGGNDTGYAQALNANGEPVGGMVAWGSYSYLMCGYVFLSQPGAVMVITAREPIYGIQFLPPDGGSLGIDPMSAPAILAEL